MALFAFFVYPPVALVPCVSFLCFMVLEEKAPGENLFEEKKGRSSVKTKVKTNNLRGFRGLSHWQ